MAEISFNRLDPRQRMAQAEINVISPPLDTASRTIRDDGHAYEPLWAPGGNPPAPSQPSPPPAPAPTEAELREVLTQCIAARDFADANRQRAQETSDRAAKHAQRCRGSLASFTGLDEEISAETIAKLRDEHCARIELSPEMLRRMASRDVAKADADAATSAEKVLAADLTEARTEAEAAARAARTAAVAVLAIEAVRKAERHDALLSEAAGLREELAQFDRIATGSGTPIPAAVLRVLRVNDVNMARHRDASQWRAALEALLIDANAVVELE
jgi:hypothetical protein